MPVVPPVLTPAPAVLVPPSRPPVLERLEELRQRPGEGRGEGQLRVRLRRRRRGGGGRARSVGGGGRWGAPLAGVEEEVGRGGLAADAAEDGAADAAAVDAVGGAVAHRGLGMKNTIAIKQKVRKNILLISRIAGCFPRCCWCCSA